MKETASQNVGADIFLREARVAWDELFSFADRRARDAAKRLRLPSDPGRPEYCGIGRLTVA